MTDTTPALEGVTPEQVAAMCKRLQMMPTYSGDPKGLHWTPDKAAAMLEALAADRDAQKARADAAEAETNKVRRFLKISRDEGGEALARAEAADAKVAKLMEALRRFDDDSDCHESGEWFEERLREARAAIAEVQTNRTTTPTEYERKVAQMKEDFPHGI